MHMWWTMVLWCMAKLLRFDSPRWNTKRMTVLFAYSNREKKTMTWWLLRLPWSLTLKKHMITLRTFFSLLLSVSTSAFTHPFVTAGKRSLFRSTRCTHTHTLTHASPPSSIPYLHSIGVFITVDRPSNKKTWKEGNEKVVGTIPSQESESPVLLHSTAALVTWFGVRVPRFLK